MSSQSSTVGKNHATSHNILRMYILVRHNGLISEKKHMLYILRRKGTHFTHAQVLTQRHESEWNQYLIFTVTIKYARYKAWTTFIFSVTHSRHGWPGGSKLLCTDF